MASHRQRSWIMTPVIEDRLQGYYLQQISASLQRLKTALRGLAENPDQWRKLARMHLLARKIADLAMIHGYEGVETIGEKIAHATHRALTSERPVDKHLITKMATAVRTMDEIVRMEENLEGEMTVERFNERIELGQRRIRSHTEHVAWHFDRHFSKQLDLPLDYDSPDQTSATGDDLFDIREVETDFMDDFADAPVVLSQVGPPEAENVNGAELTEAVGQPSRPEISVAEEVRSHLGTIEQAVYELQVVPLSVEALNEARLACEGLRASAQKVGDAQAVTLVDLLRHLIEEKLGEGESVPQFVMELLDQSLDFLNRYMADARPANDEMRDLVRKLGALMGVPRASRIQESAAIAGVPQITRLATPPASEIVQTHPPGKIRRFFRRLFGRR